MLFPLDDQIECRFLYQLALSPAVSLIPRRPESARNPCTSRFWGWYTGCAAMPVTAAGTRRRPILPAETTVRNNRRRKKRGQAGFSSAQGPGGLVRIIGNFRE